MPWLLTKITGKITTTDVLDRAFLIRGFVTALHDWPNSYECGHVESWQRALTAVKEQFGLESPILPEQENTLR